MLSGKLAPHNLKRDVIQFIKFNLHIYEGYTINGAEDNHWELSSADTILVQKPLGNATIGLWPLIYFKNPIGSKTSSA